jgi:hypothetical protein
MRMNRLDELTDAWRDGALSEDQAAELSRLLRESDEARQTFRDEARLHGMLHAAAAASAVDELSIASASSRARFGESRYRFAQRSFAATLVGVLIGAGCASLAWAFAGPSTVATMTRLDLADDGFEEQSEKLPSGFPTRFRIWSGDEVDVIDGGAARGKKALRFLRTGGDLSVPNGPANSCDVFQLIDLRPYHRFANSGNGVLEVSARFRNAQNSGDEEVIAGCHLYLFQGEPGELRDSWPLALREAVGVGGRLIPLPAEKRSSITVPTWHKVAARVLHSSQADFAVVQLSCRRTRSQSQSPLPLGAQYVDDVELTLTSQPMLTDRIWFDNTAN